MSVYPPPLNNPATFSSSEYLYTEELLTVGKGIELFKNTVETGGIPGNFTNLTVSGNATVAGNLTAGSINFTDLNVSGNATINGTTTTSGAITSAYNSGNAFSVPFSATNTNSNKTYKVGFGGTNYTGPYVGSNGELRLHANDQLKSNITMTGAGTTDPLLSTVFTGQIQTRNYAGTSNSTLDDGNGNLMTGGSVFCTGNLTVMGAGNATTNIGYSGTGPVRIGNTTGGTTITGPLTANGAINAGANSITSGAITCGAINAGANSITTSGTITTGNITSTGALTSGDITSTGTVTGNTFQSTWTKNWSISSINQGTGPERYYRLATFANFQDFENKSAVKVQGSIALGPGNNRNGTSDFSFTFMPIPGTTNVNTTGYCNSYSSYSTLLTTPLTITNGEFIYSTTLVSGSNYTFDLYYYYNGADDGNTASFEISKVEDYYSNNLILYSPSTISITSVSNSTLILTNLSSNGGTNVVNKNLIIGGTITCGAINAGANSITTSGTITSGPLTANGAINAGANSITSGAITCGAINAGVNSITTSGTITSGPLTANGAINAGANSITSGAITCGAINAGANSITTSGTITSGPLTANGAINSGAITTSGAITSAFDNGNVFSVPLSITNTNSNKKFKVGFNTDGPYIGCNGDLAIYSNDQINPNITMTGTSGPTTLVTKVQGTLRGSNNSGTVTSTLDDGSGNLTNNSISTGALTCSGNFNANTSASSGNTVIGNLSSQTSLSGSFWNIQGSNGNIATLGSYTGTGNITSAGTIIGSDITSNSLTANRLLLSDSTNKIVSSAVTNTEASYLSGVTGGIQGQLNALNTATFSNKSRWNINQNFTGSPTYFPICLFNMTSAGTNIGFSLEGFFGNYAKQTLFEIMFNIRESISVMGDVYSNNIAAIPTILQFWTSNTSPELTYLFLYTGNAYFVSDFTLNYGGTLNSTISPFTPFSSPLTSMTGYTLVNNIVISQVTNVYDYLSSNSKLNASFTSTGTVTGNTFQSTWTKKWSISSINQGTGPERYYRLATFANFQDFENKSAVKVQGSIALGPGNNRNGTSDFSFTFMPIPGTTNVNTTGYCNSYSSYSTLLTTPLTITKGEFIYSTTLVSGSNYTFDLYYYYNGADDGNTASFEISKVEDYYNNNLILYTPTTSSVSTVPNSTLILTNLSANGGTNVVNKNLIIGGDITSNSLTANRLLLSDSTNKIVSSSVTNIEASHLSGVTSGIQGQINNIISASGTINTSGSSNTNIGTGTNTGIVTIGTASKTSYLNGTTSTTNISNSGTITTGKLSVVTSNPSNYFDIVDNIKFGNCYYRQMFDGFNQLLSFNSAPAGGYMVSIYDSSTNGETTDVLLITPRTSTLKMTPISIQTGTYNYGYAGKVLTIDNGIAGRTLYINSVSLVNL